jgi:hypothetical protein
VTCSEAELLFTPSHTWATKNRSLIVIVVDVWEMSLKLVFHASSSVLVCSAPLHAVDKRLLAVHLFVPPQTCACCILPAGFLL